MKHIFDPNYRAIDIHVENIGLPDRLFGADIFINNVPVLKLLLLANVIVWIVLFLTR